MSSNMEEVPRRYKRIYAINTFGYDIKWEMLRKKKILVIGVGGLGTIFSEIFVRLGIGELTLIDFDVVEPENLNRLFFKPSDLGKNKALAAAEILHEINPAVKITPYDKDIFELKNFDDLVKSHDLIANCVDNYPARLLINATCVENDIPYVDAGVSRSGLYGYVHLVIPHKTACYQCIGSYEVTRGEQSDEECMASLPTTMNIIASLQAQVALKYLLNFGNFPDYIQYNALTEEFRSYSLKRDPNCPVCGERPKEKRKSIEEIIDSLIKEYK